MIRTHLLSWRKTVHTKNLHTYLQEVQKLPPEDREAAVALWFQSTEPRHVNILCALHLIEVAREEGFLSPLEELAPSLDSE